jgi:hypothetical protein
MLLFVLVLLCSPSLLHGQFNDAAYQEFLKANRGLTADALLQKYPAGMFRENANIDVNTAQFFSAIDSKLHFTGYERYLAGKHGFMVTERLSYPTFQAAYLDAYVKDLPVYISSDAILHALHRSYDNMLKDIELHVLVSTMGTVLDEMHRQVDRVSYHGHELSRKAQDDADVYLAVAKSLLNGKPSPAVFVHNQDRVGALLDEIKAEQMSKVVILGSTPRDYDFSQMKPRGHYADIPTLSQYFRCMVWLGRTEVHLTKPIGAEPEPTDDDILQQCMLAVILNDLAERSGAMEKLNEVDRILTAMVGEQDNLNHSRLGKVIADVGLYGPTDLADPAILSKFQQAAIDAGASQKILSQLLWSDPLSDDPITPAAAYMLIGQRFILDSYILANVVFDKVATRFMPSPLDAMFVLGNDAAAQLLATDIRQHEYALNLAGLRYLTESLDESFWSQSLYTTWLSAIRALNPEDGRSSLPLFMQTGAWWQRSLNAQLMSWTELRHDNLLYAKQSYTGGAGCFYPDGYVEAEPDLYASIASFAGSMSTIMRSIDHLVDPRHGTRFLEEILRTLDHIKITCDHLQSMARKELVGGEFSQQERDLIDNWIVKGVDDWICVKYDKYDGVYPNLMYGVDQRIEDLKPDFVVADVHTQPTDEAGNIIGKILHVATGKINTALVLADDPRDGCVTAYVGPVGSFHQHETMNFERLTDEEWATKYTTSGAPRPSWVFNYLANGDGESHGEGQRLLTSVTNDDRPTVAFSSMSASPNPATQSVVLTTKAWGPSLGERATISIADMQGRHVITLYDGPLSSPELHLDWDLKNARNEGVGAGTYIATMAIGSMVHSTTVTVLR